MAKQKVLLEERVERLRKIIQAGEKAKEELEAERIREEEKRRAEQGQTQ